MSALGAIQSAIVAIPGEKVVVPVTNSTGGTSVGNPSAGAVTQEPTKFQIQPATAAERVAAGFLTVGILGSVIGGGVFMVLEG